MRRASRGKVEQQFASTVLWRIENASLWDSDIHGWEIFSPVFALSNLGANKWIMCFLPKGEEEEDYEIILGFHPARFLEKISLDCEWSLLDGNGSPFLTRSVQYEVEGKDSGHSMPEYPAYEDVFVTRKSTFLPNDTLTVRLRIRQLHGGFAEAEQVSLVTRVLYEPTDESIVWRIEGFSALQLDQEAVASVYLKGYAFKLKVFLTRGVSLSDADVNFGVISENGSEHVLSAKISVLDKDGKRAKSVEGKLKFCSSICEQTWVLPKLVSIQEVLKKSSDWLHNNNLTLLCEFTSDLKYDIRSYIEKSYCGPENLETVIRSKVTKFKEAKRACPRTIISTITQGKVLTILSSEDITNALKCKSAFKTALFDDFNDGILLFNKMLSDFELRAMNGTFPVHKKVLSSRSPVFKDIFKGDVKESDRKFLDVYDIDAETLGMFLTFLYCGTVDALKWENAVKLYYAADKYQVLSLKQECASILQKNITLSNVSDILELSDRHRDQDLKAFVFDFIQNNFDAVILTDEWDNFMERSYLAGKTMKEMFTKKINLQEHP